MKLIPRCKQGTRRNNHSYFMEQYLSATRNLPMLPGIEISPWPTSKSTNIGILSNLQA